MRSPIRLAALSAALALAGCSSAPVEPIAQPAFYDRLDNAGRTLDPRSSLSMINQYRGNNGAAPLQWDPVLSRVAQAAADHMADEDKVLAERDLKLPEAFVAGGLKPRSYRSNLSGGYRTFAEAFSGWREAKAQNATMLDGRARQVGIATAYRPGGKYQVFWVMIVAEPG